MQHTELIHWEVQGGAPVSCEGPDRPQSSDIANILYCSYSAGRMRMGIMLQQNHNTMNGKINTSWTAKGSVIETKMWPNHNNTIIINKLGTWPAYKYQDAVCWRSEIRTADGHCWGIISIGSATYPDVVTLYTIMLTTTKCNRNLPERCFTDPVNIKVYRAPSWYCQLALRWCLHSLWPVCQVSEVSNKDQCEWDQARSQWHTLGVHCLVHLLHLNKIVEIIEVPVGGHEATVLQCTADTLCPREREWLSGRRKWEKRK